MATVVYRASSYKWIDGVLTCVCDQGMWGHPQGQTLGWISMYSSVAERDKPYMRVHEYTHTWQTFVWGILWPILYGADFLYLWAASGFGPWQDPYRKVAFERQAYGNEDAFLADKRRRWGSQ